MDAKYQFYEVVRINENCKHELLIGTEGTILGRAQDESGQWSYGVSLPKMEEVWHFPENELDFTGKINQRENFYNGSHIIVIVDPETEEGQIADDRE